MLFHTVYTSRHCTDNFLKYWFACFPPPLLVQNVKAFSLSDC